MSHQNLVKESFDSSSSNSRMNTETDTQLTHHIVAMKKVAEQHIFTKCCKCNTFEVRSDLVHDFMNFNALKIIKKIY